MSQISPPSPSDVPNFVPPKWVSWLIALVPVFPPLYLAAFGSLKLLRTLPLTARWVLFFFASTQLLAALFTPRPLLSLGLAAARTLLILAMISAGVYLRDSRNLRPLLWGQLVIFATAWGYTLYTQGFAGIQTRLGHPYYYIVSLGLVAAIALWIIFFWKDGSLWWRIPAASLAFLTFLAAESRGPLLVLALPALAVLFYALRFKPKMLLSALSAIGGLAYFSGHLLANSFASPLQRFFSHDLSGRNFVWRDAIVGWQGHPIGGLGPYQGGAYLGYLLKDGCNLTPTLEQNNINCPFFLNYFSSVWLIAHNVYLHSLIETGIFGTVGFVLLNFFIIFSSFKSKDIFIIVIVIGYTAMNFIDVISAVPSQHFSELWWIIAGLALISIQNNQKPIHSE
ncbi:O-antigen ligase family protein [Deinococcus altitudinis]|uniref:O-antigen ligase family protein n=1 Tax=Deinococcus altitudinis TaxID=468914 RepID=UPI003892C586